jgi:hypothetical protein
MSSVEPSAIRSTATRFRLRTILVVVLAVLAVAAASNALLSWRPLHQSRTSEGVPISGLREVRIDTNGAVSLTASAEGNVNVSASYRWSFRRPIATRTIHDGVLSLNGSCAKFLAGPCSVAYHIAVPAGLAVVVRTHGAGIEAIDLPTEQLQAASSGGGIVASFLTSPSRVTVQSSGGGIDLTVPRGSYRVDADSSGGDVQIDVIQDPDAANVLLARSSGGGIHIRRR